MKTYTICGSMRFQKEMIKIAYELETKKGFNILQCVYCEDKDIVLTNKELEFLKKAHFLKIEKSDGIYVVNINGYIGNAVKEEIEYAKSLNKEILYHCD
ncbi:MAG: hypothetical protein IJW82_05635 [Clostridia bacterium]|nr:hypothetical protein [Clostridia bacterium]